MFCVYSCCRTGYRDLANQTGKQNGTGFNMSVSFGLIPRFRQPPAAGYRIAPALMAHTCRCCCMANAAPDLDCLNNTDRA